MTNDDNFHVAASTLKPTIDKIHKVHKIFDENYSIAGAGADISSIIGDAHFLHWGCRICHLKKNIVSHHFTAQ